MTSNSDDELNQVFTFDTSKSLSKTRNCIYDNVLVVNNKLQLDPSDSSTKSPYENLTKVDPQYDVTSVVDRHVYVENTLVINHQNNEKVNSPHSPRTRIRTTVRDQFSRDHIDSIHQSTGFEDYDTADPVKYRDPSPSMQTRKFLTPSQQLNKFNNLSNLILPGQKTEGDTLNNFKSSLDQPKDLSELMMTLEKEFSATLSEFRNSDKSNCSSTEVRKEDSWMSDELNNELPESERDIHLAKKMEKNAEETAKTESFLRQKKPRVDWGKLKVEKSTWLGIVTRLKSEINNLEQQEEEILREVQCNYDQ